MGKWDWGRALKIFVSNTHTHTHTHTHRWKPNKNCSTVLHLLNGNKAYYNKYGTLPWKGPAV